MKLKVLTFLISIFFYASSSNAQERDSPPEKKEKAVKNTLSTIKGPPISLLLDKNEIKSTVLNNVEKIRSCFDSLPEVDRILTATVVIKFMIYFEGKVISTKILMNNSGKVALGDCISKVTKTMQFPKKPNGGIVVVRYPFLFITEQQPRFNVKESFLSAKRGWLWDKPLLRSCYSTFRKKKLGWGSVRFKFSVKKSGKIEKLKVTIPPELKDTTFSRCVKKTALQWHFSYAKEGDSMMKTIAFESQKNDPESKKKIRMMLNTHVKDTHTCTAKIPKEQKLVLNITITAGGKVTKISKVWSTIESKEVQACLEKQIRNWSFPKTGSSVSIKHPFSGTQQ